VRSTFANPRGTALSMSNRKKVLVTGASGFIGRHLVTALETHGFSVARGVRTVSSEREVQISLDPEFSWRSRLEGVDLVIHAAAIVHEEGQSVSERVHFERNCLATERLAREASECGVKRLVFFSTVAVYGEQWGCTALTETTPVNPVSAYARAKYEAELRLMTLAEETGLEIVILRPPMVYGDGAPGNYFRLTSLVRRTPFLPFGDCLMRRSFVHVNNLVDFTVACARAKHIASDIFLVSDAYDISLDELVRGIARRQNTVLVNFRVPQAWLLVIAAVITRKRLAKKLFYGPRLDVKKARRALGWTPPLQPTLYFGIDEGEFNKCR